MATAIFFASSTGNSEEIANKVSAELNNIEIFDLAGTKIEKRQDKIAKKNKFKIVSHSMQLYGTCETCQE